MPIKRYTDPRLSAMWGAIEFMVEEDEFVIAFGKHEAIITCPLRLELSGAEGFDIKLESVRHLSNEPVPVEIGDVANLWVKQNQPLLQSKYRDARRDKAEAA